MTRTTIIFLLLFPLTSFGQYDSFLEVNFFERQQNARAEAMGRSYTSIDGDLTTVYFNPAGMATIKGIEINGSYTPPPYYLTEGYYRYFSAGYKLNQYFQLALSQFHFDLGKTEIPNRDKRPFSERNTLTLSSEPIKNLLLGLNVNYLVWQPGFDKAATTFHFDFGIIKKFQFLQKQSTGHSVNIGASIANFSYSKATLEYNGAMSINDLPVVTRVGANYQFSLDKHLLIDTLKTLIFLGQGEYQNLLNSSYETAFRVGGEIMFFEILSIRAGYYVEKQNDFGYPSVNYGKLSSFTYGLGLQIPFYKLAKFPMNINFDFTTLPQLKTSNISPDWPNFTTYNLRLTWILNTKDTQP